MKEQLYLDELLRDDEASVFCEGMGFLLQSPQTSAFSLKTGTKINSKSPNVNSFDGCGRHSLLYYITHLNVTELI